jgi:hypothetical protein
MPVLTRRAALYVRVSTADRGQTIENQLQPLQEAARRLGWTVVAIYRDEGISGAKARRVALHARRPCRGWNEQATFPVRAALDTYADSSTSRRQG